MAPQNLGNLQKLEDLYETWYQKLFGMAEFTFEVKITKLKVEGTNMGDSLSKNLVN